MAITAMPVTIVTGFLGSGKTTLLNRILTEAHGEKIAVIVNEFGEIGIDNQLIVGNTDEEIFEMNNGCICCTVRGDLIRTLTDLYDRRKKESNGSVEFDRVVIETTGLADPAPVIQTFFADSKIQRRYYPDAVITVVDSKHIDQHLDDGQEAVEQIAFADLVLLNKTDLVSSEHLSVLEDRIKKISATTRMVRTQNSQLPIDEILDIRAFDLSQKLELDPLFMEPEYPFEWAGVYSLPSGEYRLVLQEGPDPSMNAVLAPVEAATPGALEDAQDPTMLAFSDEAYGLGTGGTLIPDGRLYRLDLLEPREEWFEVKIERPGDYALFTEHRPEEFGAELRGPDGPLAPVLQREYKPDHEHDESVTSVGLREEVPLERMRFQYWLQNLLDTKGQDIFRFKGVLNIQGRDERVVAQGVHMISTMAVDRPWKPDEPRVSEMVFIGRNLDPEELRSGLSECRIRSEVKQS